MGFFASLKYYLMPSFLYYKPNKSVLSDFKFRTLSKSLLERWEEVTHPHKFLITVDDLKSCRVWHWLLSNYRNSSRSVFQYRSLDRKTV